VRGYGECCLLLLPVEGPAQISQNLLGYRDLQQCVCLCIGQELQLEAKGPCSTHIQVPRLEKPFFLLYFAPFQAGPPGRPGAGP
jgi:hypothetical protein